MRSDIRWWCVPSYVLGGRAMEIVYEEESMAEFVKFAMEASPGHPILIDKFSGSGHRAGCGCGIGRNRHHYRRYYGTH